MKIDESKRKRVLINKELKRLCIMLRNVSLISSTHISNAHSRSNSERESCLNCVLSFVAVSLMSDEIRHSVYRNKQSRHIVSCVINYVNQQIYKTLL